MDRIHQKIYHLIEKRRNCLTSKGEELLSQISLMKVRVKRIILPF